MAEQLSIFEFGRQLIESNDLDPVYVVLWNAEIDRRQLCSYLLAYWCFYHMGTACWITEQRDYWKALAEAAATKTHPRASERRHFRGQAAIKAVEALRGLRLTPDRLIEGLGHREEAPDLRTVMNRVKKLRGFGDWIAFKVADMLERLGLCPVQFYPQDVFDMFDAPVKGAIELWKRSGSPPSTEPVLWSYSKVIKDLGHLKAPPRYERTINIQEIETIFCKWKSHLNGHYEVGKDIAEVRHGLVRYGRCKLAQSLIRAGRVGGLWK